MKCPHCGSEIGGGFGQQADARNALRPLLDGTLSMAEIAIRLGRRKDAVYGLIKRMRISEKQAYPTKEVVVNDPQLAKDRALRLFWKWSAGTQIKEIARAQDISSSRASQIVLRGEREQYSIWKKEIGSNRAMLRRYAVHRLRKMRAKRARK